MSTASTMMKTIDELNAPSREFYERARFKLALSLILAAIGMMLLGFCAAAGAEAQVDNIIRGNNKGVPQYYRDMMYAEGGGQGFACFAYLLGFFISVAMALYVSPLLGSENEKRMLSAPTNMDAPPAGTPAFGTTDAPPTAAPRAGEQP